MRHEQMWCNIPGLATCIWFYTVASATIDAAVVLLGRGWLWASMLPAYIVDNLLWLHFNRYANCASSYMIL